GRIRRDVDRVGARPGANRRDRLEIRADDVERVRVLTELDVERLDAGVADARGAEAGEARRGEAPGARDRVAEVADVQRVGAGPAVARERAAEPAEGSEV